jgi:hypothetical protein
MDLKAKNVLYISVTQSSFNWYQSLTSTPIADILAPNTTPNVVTLSSTNLLDLNLIMNEFYALGVSIRSVETLIARKTPQ